LADQLNLLSIHRELAANCFLSDPSPAFGSPVILVRRHADRSANPAIIKAAVSEQVFPALFFMYYIVVFLNPEENENTGFCPTKPFSISCTN
jgi:hypothetical protein